MTPIRCFLLVPTNVVEVALRRFCASSHGRVCPDHGYHTVSVPIERVIEPLFEELYSTPHSDPRWPTTCSCGYTFVDSDEWQVMCNKLYKRTDTHERMTLGEAPVGAMWNADWMADVYHGDDGRCLVVRCPGNHDWVIDSRCSNCTLPQDRTHHCWVRHGEPPNITVDKQGVTCSAGGGSISLSNWHGFLREGHLVDA